MNDNRLKARKHLEEGLKYLRIAERNIKNTYIHLTDDESDCSDDDKDFFADVSSEITILKETLEIELYGAHTGQVLTPESFVEQYHAMRKWWGEEDE